MRCIAILGYALLLPTLVGQLSVAQAAPEDARSVARGVVYWDKNGNNQRDVDEPGLEGVKVSNGLEVVATDSEGSYQLPITDDTILFVVKPRDWMTPLDEENKPQFYYIHKPHGSPDDEFVFPGVEPTGPLPESVDFALTRSSEPNKFDVLVLGDPQPATIEQVRFYANDVLAEIVAKGTTARLAIVLGDLVGDDLSLFEPLNAVQAQLGIPVYNVYGNHDMNFRALTDEHADETFNRVYGPTDYAFQVAAVHFIILDNVHWNGFLGLDEEGRPQHNGYHGALSDRQLEFVANYVATVPTEERIVVCTHIPVVAKGPAHSSMPELPRLLKILSGHSHTMSLSAHTHINQHFFLGPEDGYTPVDGTEHHHHNVGTASGSWYRGPYDEQGFPITTMRDGTPNGHLLATFDGNQYRERYKCSRLPADYQFAIHAADVVDLSDEASREVLVNVFNGNEKTTVRMRIRDRGEWMALEQAARLDPVYLANWKRDAAVAPTDRRILPEPGVTSHMWTAQLPADLPAGVHVLEVEATDMFGKSDRAVRLVEVK